MSRIVAVVNQKGGVGKTSTVVNLSAALAELGKRVLIVDSDAQAHACKSLGFDPTQASISLYHILTGRAELADAIVHTGLENLWLVPSETSLAATEVELASRTGKEFILARALETVLDHFDYVFVDCPPFLGILTINALVASTDVLITSALAYLSLEGVSDLLDLIEVINDNLYLPRKVVVTGVLACIYDQRTSISLHVYKELERYFGDKLFDTVIPINVAINYAQTDGQPVIHHAPMSKGAAAYRRLAREILRREHGA